MSETTKLRAPKGISSISVAGAEYEVVKGWVTVLIEHVGELVGHGFKGVDDEAAEAAIDPGLPAGVSSDLSVSNQGGYVTGQPDSTLLPGPEAIIPNGAFLDALKGAETGTASVTTQVDVVVEGAHQSDATE